MSDKVEMTREMWDEAARACEKFASSLESATFVLKQVGATNFYGECSEGRTVRRNIRSAIADGELSWAALVGRQRDNVADLGVALVGAGRDLRGRDGANSLSFHR